MHYSAKYTYAANNVKWDVTDENSLVSDGLTIYCGGDNFTPNTNDGANGNTWIDMTSMLIVYGLPHNGDDNADFCSVHGTASTLDVSLITNDPTAEYKLIVLCDGALIRGISPDSTGSQSGIGAIQALPQRAGLYPGKLIDNIAYTVALSFTLLHELMHVTQSSSCESSVQEQRVVPPASSSSSSSTITDVFFLCSLSWDRRGIRLGRLYSFTHPTRPGEHRQLCVLCYRYAYYSPSLFPSLPFVSFLSQLLLSLPKHR